MTLAAHPALGVQPPHTAGASGRTAQAGGPLPGHARGRGRRGRRDPCRDRRLQRGPKAALLPRGGRVCSPPASSRGETRKGRSRVRGTPLVRRLGPPGRAAPARFPQDAAVQHRGRVRGSTGQDGRLAPARMAWRQAPPGGVVRPNTQPPRRGAAVPAGGTASPRRRGVPRGRKCRDPLVGHPHEAQGITPGIDESHSRLSPVVGWPGVLVLTLEQGDGHG
jgi:hypothetical protein